MNTSVTLITRSTAVVAAVAAFSLSACLESTSSTGTPSSSNRFGYGGTSTVPSGVNQQPTAAPDGALGRAISGHPTGTMANQKVTDPAAGSTGTVGAPILPLVDPNPTAPPTVDPKKPAAPPNAGAAAAAGGVNPSGNVTPTPKSPPKKVDYPYGIPVPGREGLVYSPYDKEAGYVDVRGLKPGSLVEDPYSKKYFRVP